MTRSGRTSARWENGWSAGAERSDIPNQRQVLITGAAGFLGRHVARAFADAGWSVNGIGHGSWSRDEFARWGVSAWHAGDITLDALLAHAGEPDAVVHCAGSGQVSFSLQQPLQDFARNVGTTAAVLEFLRSRALGATMLLASSAAVYGNAAASPIVEDAQPHPLSPYGMHKLLAEQLCESYSRSFGLQVRVLRLFSVYGRGLRKQLLWDACNRLRAGGAEFSGSGGELRDWLHVRDAAALILALTRADTPAHWIFNGGTGVGIAVSEILAELSSALGTAKPVFNGQRRPGDPLTLVADAARATSLGWRPLQDWRRGVREYADWHRSSA